MSGTGVVKYALSPRLTA